VPHPSFEPLDPDALTGVVGGFGSNIDVTTNGWRTVLTAPLPSDWALRARTLFGGCVDRALHRCNTRGGSNAGVGECQLQAADDCWEKTKKPQ